MLGDEHDDLQTRCSRVRLTMINEYILAIAGIPLHVDNFYSLGLLLIAHAMIFLF